MKHLFLLLAFLLPSLSFASYVPPQIPAQYLSSGYWSLFPQTSASVLNEFVCGSKICFPSPNSSFAFNWISTSTPDYSDSWSILPSGWCSQMTGGTPHTFSFSSSTVSSCASYIPGQDFVFVNVYSWNGTATSSSQLVGYAKFRFDGTRWVDTLGAGASGSWTFSTSSPINPLDFDSFSQGLKDAIANNTYQPSCSGTTIADLFAQTFWQDCVLPTIFNWLFVPSDSAIDYMVEQMSSNAQFGSSFAYLLIMPVASAVSVTACDLDDVPSCSVGSPLTIPLLDVHGSSTPFVFDPVSPLPGYFDDWLSAIVAVLILAGVSRVVLLKFL